jgi:excisionase family DNA binding protein
VRDVRDSQRDLWGFREAPRHSAPAADHRDSYDHRDDAGAALARALTGVTHLPSHLADIEARLGRIEAGMEHLRRALPPLLVTLPEAGRALGVSYATVRRMKKAGRLPMVGSGRSARVDLTALHAPGVDEVTRAVSLARGQGPAAARERQEDDDGAT